MTTSDPRAGRDIYALYVRDERWKYTSLDAFARQSFAAASAGAAVPAWAADTPLADGYDVADIYSINVREILAAELESAEGLR